MYYETILAQIILKTYISKIIDIRESLSNMTEEQLYSYLLFSCFNKKYRILITGARDYSHPETVRRALLAYLPQYCIVVHGGCSGADTIAGNIAKEMGFEVEVFPPNWKLGRAAGPIRNIQMLDTKPNIVLVFHDNLEKSKGTKHCASEAEKRQLKILYLAQSTEPAEKALKAAVPPSAKRPVKRG